MTPLGVADRYSLYISRIQWSFVTVLGPLPRKMNALILDMDGVVVDSVDYWNEIRTEIIATELGVDDVDISELVGMNAHDEYEYLSERHTLGRSKESYVSLIEDHAREVYHERVSLFPELPEVLRTAIDNEIRPGLVSASYRTRVEMVVRRFDLKPYFDVVVAGDDVPGPSKPDPAIYDHAVSRLGADAAACIAVEDSEHGVSAAKEAGLYCLGYAHHPGQPLEHADERIGSAGALRSRLAELCRDRTV